MRAAEQNEIDLLILAGTGTGAGTFTKRIFLQLPLVDPVDFINLADFSKTKHIAFVHQVHQRQLQKYRNAIEAALKVL